MVIAIPHIAFSTLASALTFLLFDFFVAANWFETTSCPAR
jgi:hypothetical protein